MTAMAVKRRVVIFMITSTMFKYIRFLTVSAVTETFLILSMGLASYEFATYTKILGLEMSGIISLITCSII